jgi:branched-chain amino acid transport system ATP-binding protein
MKERSRQPRGHAIRWRAADARRRPRAHVRPKLLLLDEPSAGLAPVVVQSIFEVVRKMSAEGYTVLIVEQNIRQVLAVADRGYLLETGRIKSSGTASELLATDAVRRAYLGI